MNDAMAIAAMNYVHKLLMREPVQSFVTYVDLTTNNMRSVPLTRENLRRHVSMQKTMATPRDLIQAAAQALRTVSSAAGLSGIIDATRSQRRSVGRQGEILNQQRR